MLPSDICKIYKSGSSIRVDTTIVDFSEMRWERGDLSILFKGDMPLKVSKYQKLIFFHQNCININFFQDSLTMLDNEYECYQKIRYESTEMEMEDEVDILMSSDILDVQISTKSVHFDRSQTGWIFRENKTVCNKAFTIFCCILN